MNLLAPVFRLLSRVGRKRKRSTEPIVAWGAGYVIRGDSIVLKEGVTIEEFAAAFPFFQASDWGLFCINIERACDGMGSRFITFQVKARLGKYLESWDSFELRPFATKQWFPDWLDAEFDEKEGYYYFYGVRR